MAESIRDFLVSIGYKIDESTERRFISSMEMAVLKANLLAVAIEDMARTVVEKVGNVANQFEQLFYQSQRVGSSAQSIKAFEYAVSQLGGSIEGANSSLEAFGRWVRNTPGALNWVATQLHVQTKDLSGVARDNAAILIDIGERLSHMPPFLAERYRQMLGIDEKTMFAIEHAPEALKRYQESLKSQAGAGITGEAMRQATEFEKAWREVWQRIGTMAEGGESKLLTALTEPMKKFNEWLDQHSPEINDAIGKMADAVGRLTLAWTQNLDKVQWPDVAEKLQHAADSMVHLVDGMVRLTAELTKDLPALQALLGALVGARIGSMFSPWGAALGAGVGALAPGMIEHWQDNDVPDTGGFWSGIWGGIKRFFGGGSSSGPGPYNYNDVPNAGALTKLITAEAQRAGIDPRIMEGIRAGESGHSGKYDIKDDALESSWGPFQLNRRRGLGVQFEKDTGLDLRDPSTIPAQVRWVAEYLKRTHGDTSPWMGFHGLRDADPRWGDSGYVPQAPATATKAPSVPLGWDNNAGPAWAAINAQLPVGPVSNDNSSRNFSSVVNNTVNVSSTDPHTAAAMVGVSLDRTAADVARNLQGAAQ